MLILDAEIRFDLPSENPFASSRDIANINPIRPAINFGNNYLSSGTIIIDKKIKAIVRGQIYRAVIEMPLIESEAYEFIKDYLKIDNTFLLQAGSSVRGKGKILDFVYEGEK